MVQFDSFNLPEPVLRALADMGFTTPSPIQADAIPVLLTGRDIIAQAQTGTGKTAAFGIPLVMAALEGRPAIVLVPTRELAQQVAAEIDRIGKHAGIKALALYGGAPFGEQARAIQRGEADLVVATPGRLRDHIERGTIEPSAAKLVVLDEADEMLKMGFVDEVEAILDAVGPDRQTLLFSATMPEPVVRLAERYLREPQYVVSETENHSVANAGTEQFVVAVEHREKADALVRLLAVERPTAAIVFRHTRESVEELVQQLRAKNVAAEGLHGGMAQGQREDVLDRVREGRTVVLVATNVAARGLDIDRVTHVINFDTPREADAYVHRIGRTGRAGRDGTSFLFVTPMERGKLRNIERTLGSRLAWREIPTDDEVRAAVASRAAEWLTARAADATPESLAAIDAAGGDPRALAAALWDLVARREGFTMPPLEPRRARSQQPERARNERDARHPRAHVEPRARNRDAGPPVPLVLNVGRDDGVRPADIVGALTHEGGLTGADVGRIDILPRMSVAEVPADCVEALLDVMSRATIRGRHPQPRVAQRWEFRSASRQAAPRTYAR